MIRLNDIVDKVNSYLYLNESEVDLINRAYIYSAKVHTGQTRSSGEPYLSHPLEVTNILANMELDVSSIVTGLLHDTVEDTLTDLEDIENLFGEEIAFLVDGLTKISKIPFSSNIERQAESFRKLILATANDIRVVVIKLADRLHNMRTLQHLPKQRQMRIAEETFEIYAPLARRFGINWMTTELEDLSFKFTNPKEFKRLSTLISEKKNEWSQYINDVKKKLQDKLTEYGIKSEVTGRFKHNYSIYKKMNSYNVGIDKVYDIMAFRIITESIKECYEALGAIHSSWKPIPGRFKDYIALPKGNGYQSLHTIVIGPDGDQMEIQIRTRKMHDIAEYGVAAHWKYKEGEKENGDKASVYYTLRQLLEWKDIKDPNEYMEAIKGELISNVVYVFTPKGDLKELPSGATPVDFAYSIHTEVGNHCVRATANGNLVPLDHRLKTGDTIEIITSKDKKPNRDWLNFVTTSRAKTKIKSWLRNDQSKRAEKDGKPICERKFKQNNLNFQKISESPKFLKLLSKLRCNSLKDLFVAVGFGSISVNDIVNEFLPEKELLKDKKKEDRIEKIVKTLNKNRGNDVLVKGYGDVMIRIGNCCSPLPGEKIVGFITRGKGITIHKEDCPQLLEVDPDRRIDVEWDKDYQQLRTASIKVVCEDKPGMLSSITSSFSVCKINISKAEMISTNIESAVGSFDIMVQDVNQLDNVINAIKKLKGVKKVERVLNKDTKQKDATQI